MGDPPKAQLTLLQGGRTDDGPPTGRALPREALRVIPGGPAGDLQAAIEETVQAARRMRQEIEERIAKALEELF
jgi:dissimilatory sulfite reductase (desulfoviridin) alpha/beta subunit